VDDVEVEQAEEDKQYSAQKADAVTKSYGLSSWDGVPTEAAQEHKNHEDNVKHFYHLSKKKARPGVLMTLPRPCPWQ
jgi:hypothetical protein